MRFKQLYIAEDTIFLSIFLLGIMIALSIMIYSGYVSYRLKEEHLYGSFQACIDKGYNGVIQQNDHYVCIFNSLEN